jgi:hypothetical protein
MSEKCLAHATATQQAAADEQLQHAAFAAFAFVLVFIRATGEFATLTLILVLILASGLCALTKELGQQGTTDATAPQYPASDDEAQDLAVITATFLVGIVVDFLVVVVLGGRTVFVNEVRQQQPADAGATQQAARDQKFQQAVFLVATFLVVRADVVAFLGVATFTQQLRKKQAPHAPAAEHMTSD